MKMAFARYRARSEWTGRLSVVGIKACMEGFTIYFTYVQRLLTQIREAKAQKML